MPRRLPRLSKQKAWEAECRRCCRLVLAAIDMGNPGIVVLEDGSVSYDHGYFRHLFGWEAEPDHFIDQLILEALARRDIGEL